MPPEIEQKDRDRITRLEEQNMSIQRGLTKIEQLIQDIGRELRATFVPRGELEERFRAQDARADRLETRMRDAEQGISALQTRPEPKPEEPGWTKLLLALVSVLGGALVTLIVTLAIYYQARQ